MGKAVELALRVIRESEVSLDPLRLRTVAVIGYGNQGRSHALNLRDSGVKVIIGQREGTSHQQAVADGWKPVSVSAASDAADLLILSLPDESASTTYRAQIAPLLRDGQALGFLHGFNIRFGFIRPPAGVDVVMVAPKGPGTLLRSLYTEGRGLPALVAVDRDAGGHARALALAWAAAIGAARAGIVETTFASETETDLFGEQAVLCGGVTALAKAAFETLVAAGYEPEFAYLECVHELKQVVDLIYAKGISGMRDRISRTAQYGDVTRGPELITEEVREKMRKLLDDIRTGVFAAEWLAEHQAGEARFRNLRECDRLSPIEEAGKKVRALMPWLT